MKIKTLVSVVLMLTVVTIPALGNAAVISGTIVDWDEFGTVQSIGDGKNHVTMWWTLNTLDRGWFYGSSLNSVDSDVAIARGITDISQITDASAFTFTNGAVGPVCDAECDPDGVGDFVVWRNTNTGYFGALRIDDINVIDIRAPIADLDGTWWFQTDGTGNFSTIIPLPAGLPLFLSGLAALGAIFRKKQK